MLLTAQWFRLNIKQTPIFGCRASLSLPLKIFLQAFASAAFAFAAANAIETQERTIRLRQKLKRIFYR